MQSIRCENEWLFDVAHNPAAAETLAHTLARRGDGDVVAIIGMLDDKDVEGVVAPLADIVERWVAVTAASQRGIEAAELARRIANRTNKACLIADSIESAVVSAREFAGKDGRVLVTGSFYVVGPVIPYILPTAWE